MSTGPTGPTGVGIQFIALDNCETILFMMTDGQTKSISVQGCFATGMTGPTGMTGATISGAYIDSMTNTLNFIMNNGQIISGGVFPLGPTGPGGDASYTGSTGPTGPAGIPNEYIGTGFFGPGIPNSGTLYPVVMNMSDVISLLRQPNTYYPVQFGLNVASSILLPHETSIILGSRDDPGSEYTWNDNKEYTIAIGYNSGWSDQQPNAIAIGSNSGSIYQSSDAIAIGRESGFSLQGYNGICIGTLSGVNQQNEHSIAIGAEAGNNNQGVYNENRINSCYPGVGINITGECFVYTTQMWNNFLFIGGDNVTSSDETTVTYLATYDTETLQFIDIFGTGLNGPCHSLYIVNSLLFIGGRFTTADGVLVNNIVAYNLNTREWLHSYFKEGVTFSNNADAYVYTMCLVDNILYVGGSFDTADLINGYINIAGFNLTTTEWFNQFLLDPNEINGVIKTIVNIENILYIGGTFVYTLNVGGPNPPFSDNFVSFDILTRAFNILFSLSDECVQIITSGYILYMCGLFNEYMIQYDTQTTEFTPLSFTTSPVYTISIVNQKLYYAGVNIFESYDLNNYTGMSYIDFFETQPTIYTLNFNNNNNTMNVGGSFVTNSFYGASGLNIMILNLIYDMAISSTAIGTQSGYNYQAPLSISIGAYAQNRNTVDTRITMGAISVGNSAGGIYQHTNSIAMGNYSGLENQHAYCVAIGYNSGNQLQGSGSVCIGANAGYNTQGKNSVAIGNDSGKQYQKDFTVAIGNNSGILDQNSYSVSIGSDAGYLSQGTGAIAIGYKAGYYNQLDYSISIGYQSGSNVQRECITIGKYSGMEIGERNIYIGVSAGYSQDIISSYNIGIGYYAGYSNQAESAISIGYESGYDSQGNYSISIGTSAGYYSQNDNSVAIGHGSGYDNMGQLSVAIGPFSGNANLGEECVAIGNFACYTGGGNYSIGIGSFAGYNTQSSGSIGIGYSSGYISQGENTVGIGSYSGYELQGNNSVAVGHSCGYNAQGIYSVAMGYKSGYTQQGIYNVAMGYMCGYTNQLDKGVAIGYQCGMTGQAYNSIAIGNQANPRGSNSIVLSAVDYDMSRQGTGALYINPIRQMNGNSSIRLYYQWDNEITWGTDSSSVKYKTNVNNLSKQYADAVYKLRPVEFNYKNNGKKSIGFIAEEVNEIIPEIVTKINGEIEGVEYEHLIAPLVTIIQELRKEIDEIKSTLNK